MQQLRNVSRTKTAYCTEAHTSDFILKYVLKWGASEVVVIVVVVVAVVVVVFQKTGVGWG